MSSNHSSWGGLNQLHFRLPKFLRRILLPKKIFYQRQIAGRISYSDAGQDLFVIDMHQHKKNGFYIEIGAAYPIRTSNTIMLELAYDWTGISFEIVPDFVDSFNTQRKNNCVQADATKFDYLQLFKSKNVPNRIDYLQVDIEPAQNTLDALKQLPLNDYRFSVITFEHDRYLAGDAVMSESRTLLEGLGYKLVARNVMVKGKDFEDWWVDPLAIDEEIFKKFLTDSAVEYSTLFA
jgi:hypothetical protein